MLDTTQASAGPVQVTVYEKEKTFFTISLVFSILVWALVLIGTVGIALVYLLLFFIMYLFAQSGLISHLKGTAVRISEKQLPDLHQRIQQCSHRVGMPVPEAYLLNGSGIFNAMATRFLGRNFIVLYSDVVDALEANPASIDFYIGHELGHLRRKHLQWHAVLLPGSILPLLGAAYSRACEYTCDRYGLACSASIDDAKRGMAALAAGKAHWRTISLDEYGQQANESGGFWMSFHELTSIYPWLVKRMELLSSAERKAVRPSRHPLAFVLAIFVPNLGIAGGAASMLVTVAIIGILAAVAIPAYQDYTVRAQLMEPVSIGRLATVAVSAYYYKNNKVPERIEDAGFTRPKALSTIEAVTIDKEGVIDVVLSIPQVKGKVLKFVPRLDADKRIVWRCAGGEIPAKYLPTDCRQSATE